MSTWLVTGGAGFIGANLVRRLVELGVDVVVLDALTYAGDLGRLDDLADCFVLVEGDICDAPLVDQVFAGHHIDRVLHLAAESHVDRSIQGPAEFIRTNIEGTYTLLEGARKAWQGKIDRFFLHVSTDEVFGSLDPSDPAFDEDSPYRPSSPYSSSKASSDHLALAWHTTYGLPVAVSNCSNNYGPWQYPEKLLPLMILNAMEGRELPVYGDGLQVRDWLHVDDHVAALVAIAERGKPGQRYCIGGSCERVNLKVVEQVCDAVDALLSRPQGAARELIRHVTDRPGHDRRYAIDSSKMRREMGWNPSHLFEEALPEMVRWYADHPDWCASVRSRQYEEFYAKQYGDRDLRSA